MGYVLRLGQTRRQVAVTWCRDRLQWRFPSCFKANFTRKCCCYQQILSLRPDTNSNLLEFLCRVPGTKWHKFSVLPCVHCSSDLCLGPNKKWTNGKVSFVIYILKGMSSFCIEGPIMFTSSMNVMRYPRFRKFQGHLTLQTHWKECNKHPFFLFLIVTVMSTVSVDTFHIIIKGATSQGLCYFRSIVCQDHYLVPLLI